MTLRVIVANAAQGVGDTVGRLLLPLVRAVLIVMGNRRRVVARQSPVPQSDGKSIRISGWVLVVVGVLGALSAGGNSSA